MNPRTPETHLGDGELRRLIGRAADPRGAAGSLFLIVILAAIVVLNPSFAEPGALMRFIQRVSPIAIVAIGQYFVIVSGEFDLSMGAVVTAQVMTAGYLIGEDGSKTVPVLLLMLVLGVVIGIVNVLVTTSAQGSLFHRHARHDARPPRRDHVVDGRSRHRQSRRVLPTDRAGRDHRSSILDPLPYAVLILVAMIAFAVWISYRPFGLDGDSHR